MEECSTPAECGRKKARQGQSDEGADRNTAIKHCHRPRRSAAGNHFAKYDMLAGKSGPCAMPITTVTIHIPESPATALPSGVNTVTELARNKEMEISLRGAPSVSDGTPDDLRRQIAERKCRKHRAFVTNRTLDFLANVHDQRSHGHTKNSLHCTFCENGLSTEECRYH